jgi:hypothetical protein
MTLVEARIVLLRTEERSKVFDLVERISKIGIDIIPYGPDIDNISMILMRKYQFLNTFDSIHIATAMITSNEILSTDHIFPKIEEVEVINPLEYDKTI